MIIRILRRWYVLTACLGAVIIAGAFFGSCSAPAAHADSTPLVYICQQQPCQNAQEFEVFDSNQAPIFSVGEYGDVGTYGTGFDVNPPGSFNPVIKLNTDGTIDVGGQVLTPADVALLNQVNPAELGFLRGLWCASLPRYQQQVCLPHPAVKR